MKLISWNCQDLGRAVTHDDYIQIVEKGWNVAEGIASDRVLDLIRRLGECRKKLLEWSRRAFPNFRKVIEQLRKELSLCYEGPFTNEKLGEAEALVQQIEEAWGREETYWW
ncbi:hypothetical protein K1719_043983 [Acacia pycnantha]|nr:hypothetical protein K1719_043983 [Acacia pycnantha]